MNTEKIFVNKSLIINLDVDPFLSERLTHISQAGFSLVEINSSDPLLLKKILTDFPTLKIGAGNIINTQQLEQCYEANVHFISSPGFLPEIAQTASIYSMNYIPGIATFSEAMQILALGYRQARPYPACLSFCKDLNKYFPMLRLFPAEIEWGKAEQYFKLPAVAAASILNPEIEHLTTLSTRMFA